jgi:hypothetical protein
MNNIDNQIINPTCSIQYTKLQLMQRVRLQHECILWHTSLVCLQTATSFRRLAVIIWHTSLVCLQTATSFRRLAAILWHTSLVCLQTATSFRRLAAILWHISLVCLQTATSFRRLAAIPSPRTPWFKTRPVHLDLWWTKCYWDRSFSACFSDALSVSFHKTPYPFTHLSPTLQNLSNWQRR